MIGYKLDSHATQINFFHWGQGFTGQEMPPQPTADMTGEGIPTMEGGESDLFGAFVSEPLVMALSIAE